MLATESIARFDTAIDSPKLLHLIVMQSVVVTLTMVFILACPRTAQAIWC